MLDAVSCYIPGGHLGILLLEDDPCVRELLADVLLDEFARDCDIFLASTGPEALQIAEQHNPDLLLLDYQLVRGGMNGLEVYDQLWREHKMPAIMMSASPPDIGSRSLDLLNKPFDLEELFERIKCSLQWREATLI